MTAKRAEVRVAFGSLLEAGLVKPGQVLHDTKRRHAAIVRADGTVAVNGHAGSIHKMGATVQELDACNGWTFWHYEEAGKLRQIDEIRRVARDAMAVAG